MISRFIPGFKRGPPEVAPPPHPNNPNLGVPLLGCSPNVTGHDRDENANVQQSENANVQHENANVQQSENANVQQSENGQNQANMEEKREISPAELKTLEDGVGVWLEECNNFNNKAESTLNFFLFVSASLIGLQSLASWLIMAGKPTECGYFPYLFWISLGVLGGIILVEMFLWKNLWKIQKMAVRLNTQKQRFLTKIDQFKKSKQRAEEQNSPTWRFTCVIEKVSEMPLHYRFFILSAVIIGVLMTTYAGVLPSVLKIYFCGRDLAITVSVFGLVYYV